jgi:hypothetical protein
MALARERTKNLMVTLIELQNLFVEMWKLPEG